MQLARAPNSSGSTSSYLTPLARKYCWPERLALGITYGLDGAGVTSIQVPNSVEVWRVPVNVTLRSPLDDLDTAIAGAAEVGVWLKTMLSSAVLFVPAGAGSGLTTRARTTMVSRGVRVDARRQNERLSWNARPIQRHVARIPKSSSRSVLNEYAAHHCGGAALAQVETRERDFESRIRLKLNPPVGIRPCDVGDAITKIAETGTSPFQIDVIKNIQSKYRRP